MIISEIQKKTKEYDDLIQDLNLLLLEMKYILRKIEASSRDNMCCRKL